MTFPTQATLSKLRSEAQRVDQSIVLPAGVDMLWPHLSNTDLMNLHIGHQEPEYTWISDDQGFPHLLVSTKFVGKSHVYYEAPYEWEAHRYLSVERVYDKGFFKYLKYGLELTKIDNSQTQVQIYFDFVHKAPQMVVKSALKNTLKTIHNLFVMIADNVSKYPSRSPASGYFDSPNQWQKQINSLIHSWSEIWPNLKEVSSLAEYIFCAPETYVQHLRPREVAEFYQLPLQNILELCLAISQKGDFNTRWAVLCTSCWGSKNEMPKIDRVQNEHYCESCSIQYNTTFNENLELVFSPVSKIRQTQTQRFCAGSPSNTGHIVYQKLLNPGEKAKFEPDPTKAYSLWINQQKKPLDPTENLIYTADELTLIRIEDHHQFGSYLTAAQAFANPTFLETFSDQLPSPNSYLKASSLVILFCHIELEPTSKQISAEIQDILNLLGRESEGAPVNIVSPTHYTLLFHNNNDAIYTAQHLFFQLEEMQLMYSEHRFKVQIYLQNLPCQVFSDNDSLCLDLKAPDISVSPDDFGMHFWVDSKTFDKTQNILCESGFKWIDEPDEGWVHFAPLPQTISV